MMAILRYEFRQIRCYIIWWAAAIALLTVTMLPTYIGFITGPKGFDVDMFASFMDNKFIAAVGLSSDLLTRPIGMYSFLTEWIFC